MLDEAGRAGALTRSKDMLDARLILLQVRDRNPLARGIAALCPLSAVTRARLPGPRAVLLGKPPEQIQTAPPGSIVSRLAVRTGGRAPGRGPLPWSRARTPYSRPSKSSCALILDSRASPTSSGLPEALLSALFHSPGRHGGVVERVCPAPLAVGWSGSLPGGGSEHPSFAELGPKGSGTEAPGVGSGPRRSP